MTNERLFEAQWSVLVAAVALLMGYTGGVRAQERFEPAACPSVVRESVDAQGLPDVECGYVEVPENYRQHRSRTRRLRIFVVIAHTQALRPRTPVFFLTGGPGQALSGIAGQVITTGVMGRLRSQRDVVLIDPRGAGFSEPRLGCPPPMPPAAASILTPAQQDAVRCADLLSAQGVDLDAYDTPTLARDVASVRAALRLRKVVIYGVSYGAFLGLQTLRHARDWVESAVLVSPPRPTGGTMVRSPQSAQGALDEFTRMCAAQSACAAQGNFADNVDVLLARLLEQPIDLGVSASGVPLQLTADLLGIFLQQAFSNPQSASTLPKAVALALQGDASLWVPVVTAFFALPPIDQSLFFSLPLHNSVWCSEELTIGSPEELERRAAGTNAIVQRISIAPPRAEYETCAVWPVPEAPQSLYARFTTDIPTYLISGALDHVTPPEYARRALRYLANGQLTIVAAAGHLASENSACAPALVERFLEAPYERVDDACTATPVQFVP
ncbi:MAG TPA: alpha/beta hydrolase [Polyangiales bacterium]|nr:alpha/beta hydrolase [Polyangiales bacterium]